MVGCRLERERQTDVGRREGGGGRRAGRERDVNFWW